MRSQRHKRYKLLLDQGLPPRQNYRELNSLHDVKHIKHDLKFAGLSDEKVFAKASREGRLLVTFNIKDFQFLIQSNKPSVIALSTQLSNKRADLKIIKALKEIKTSQMNGYLISISNSGIIFKHIYAQTSLRR